MRHRIFVDRIEPRTEVRGDELHHAVRVVRVRPGEEVEMFDRAGGMARGTVESIDRDLAVIVAGPAIPSREALLSIHLAVAIIQFEKFELVLQKATELGVKTLIPLITDRIEIRPERWAGKLERWEKIVFEAVKQSGRSAPPAVLPPMRYQDALGRAGIRLILDADAEPSPVEQLTEATLFIGPEGGWSKDELETARASHCRFMRLGPRRLRAETAAIAATAVVMARYGDL